MKRLFFNTLCVITCIIFCASNLQAQDSTLGAGTKTAETVYEDFEASAWAGTNYTQRTVAGLMGNWIVAGVGTMDATDRYHGTRSIRLRGNSGDNCRVEMDFDKTDGMGVVTFAYASYAAHNNGQISLHYSTNQGATWISAGSVNAPAWGGEMLTATFTLNIEGNVRIKIARDGSLASSTSVNIDDVTITDFDGSTTTPVIIASPTSLSFGNVEVETTASAQTITVSGSALTDDITYVTTGADADAFTITETTWDPAEGGILSITFSPTEARAYSATLNLSSEDAESKTVTLTGIGIEPVTTQLVAKWNEYAQVSNHDPIFLATDGSAANNGIATLTRDAAGAGYTVNADGIAASTTWQDATTIDKYWITTFSTIGFTDLTVTSKQRGSNTGPKYFKIQYKVGASGTWADVADGTIVVLNDTYVSGVKENLPLPSDMSNQAEVSLRWICTSTESINGSPVVAAGVNRLDVAIYGEPTTPEPFITINPTSLAFGNVETETTSTAQTVTVSGTDLSDDITYTTTGADASAFTITETTWNPAEGGTLSITFSPTEARFYQATLVLSSDGAESKTVALTGTGIIISDFIWGESFEYEVGSLLTANGWVAHNSGLNPITVSEGSLSYLSYAPSGVGNKVTLATTGQDVNYPFPSGEIASGDLYAAFMVNVTSAQATGDYFAHFMGTSSAPYCGRVYAKSVGAGYQLGIVKLTSTIDYAEEVLDFGTDYLVVMKYETILGNNNDKVSIFVNPVVGSPEPATPSATASDVTAPDPFLLMGFALRQGEATFAPEVSVGGIRVAKTWDEAVKYLAMPTLFVSSTSLDFGDVETASTSPAQTITISGVDLTNDISYVKQGDDDDAFTITETAWDPAEGGTLSITFSPTEERVYEATLVLSSEDAGSKTVTLTGTGIEPITTQLVAKWNEYEQVSNHDPIFLATGGSVANDGIATLTRDAAGAGYTVNADGIAASTTWQDATTIDKYWITTFSTIGFTDLTVTSKQRGSNTGPKHFKLQYKVGASGTWADVADGTIVVLNDTYVSGVKENLPLP